MLVFFILLTLVVQIAFLVIARNAAAVALDAAVRRVAVAPERIGDERLRLVRDVQATVPGTGDLHVVLDRDGTTVVGLLSFHWQPPGPDLLPVTIAVERQVPILVPP